MRSLLHFDWLYEELITIGAAFCSFAFGCAERDSPRDQLIVTLFLLTVFGLLLGAGIKGKMEKAGLDLNKPLSNGRRWWEVSDGLDSSRKTDSDLNWGLFRLGVRE